MAKHAELNLGKIFPLDIYLSSYSDDVRPPMSFITCPN
jgi:hypothetical protein